MHRHLFHTLLKRKTALNRNLLQAAAISAFDLQAVGLVFDSKPRSTYVVKTDSDNSNAKRSALGVNATGPSPVMVTSPYG